MVKSIINNTRDLLNAISKLELEMNGINTDIRKIKSAKATITQPTNNQLLTWNAEISMVEDSLWQLPAADGAANEIIYTDGAGNLDWIAPGAAAVAGADTQVQYNAGGVMAAEAAFTYNYNTNTLTADHVQATADFTPNAADGATLGTAALEFSDLYLADGGIIYLGDDQDVTLTHIPDQSISLNLSFRMVSTTSAYTGVIYKGTDRFFHDFHHPTGGGAVPTGQNLFIGENAGNFTMGAAAVAVNQASYNLGIGTQVLLDNTLGDANLGCGYRALYNNTEGRYNVALGMQSLYVNTVGNYNLAIGYRALYLNLDGMFNTGIGASTLYNCDDGNYNVGLGTNALNALQSGDSNAAFGYRALFLIVDTDYNVAMGHLAGTYLVGGGNNTASSNSVFIGRDTRPAADTQTNQIVIGDQAQGIGSNTTVLGNTNTVTTRIYGDIQIDSDTDMLIVGDGQDAGIYYNGTNMVFDSQLVGAGDFYFANGDVGIATNSPLGRLDVSYGGLSLIIGADNSAISRTNNTTKYGRIGLAHYTNAEEPVTLIHSDSRNGDNIVSVGGGTGSMNAATIVRIYTAANNTTTTGTERVRIESDGGVYMYAIKSGATQAAAGAAANEIWETSGHGSLPDHVLMLGT